MNKQDMNFDYKRLHPFKWFILENYPFLEDSIDVLTNYQLFCKLGEMYNKQVDSINTLGIQVENITDWFDNLDVQEEINNKLDEMAESGDLEEIISAYLNTKALLCFDTIEDLKSADNLANGCFAKTLGYYSVNDGGSATYKIRTITNDDVVDDMIIIELSDNTLIAELIPENKTINSIQVGCKIEDNTFDNGIKLNAILNWCNTNHINFNFLGGRYYVDTPISINEKLFSITISGLPYNLTGGVEAGTILDYTGDGYCLTLQKGGLCYTLQGLTFECNNASNGLNCDGSGATNINFKNHITDINVRHAIIGAKITSSTYTFIDNYTFGGDTNTQIGLLIEGYEFTYINNSSIDGFSQPNNSSIGLKISGGLNIYVNNLDICNFGQGKAIYLTDTTKDLYTLYFDNINIIRCDGGIVTECANHNITGISYSNILISLSGTNAGSYYFHSIPGSYNISNVSIENLTIRNLATTTIPDYIYIKDTKAVSGLYLHIKDLYNCPIYKSGINGSGYDSYIYKNNQIKQMGSKYVSYDGTSTQYTFDIDYPVMGNIPVIEITVMNQFSYYYTMSNYDSTTHKLKCNFVFQSAPTGTGRINWIINERGFNS